MNRKRQSTITSEDLFSGYYGHGPEPKELDEVIATYYGAIDVQSQPVSRPATAVSLSIDDGEVLTQNGGNAPPTEYVVDIVRSMSAVEYIVDAVPTAPTAPTRDAAWAAPVPPTTAVAPPAPEAADVSAKAEREVDLLGLADPAPLSSGERAQASSTVSDDDLAADMEAILTGQKVFDPVSKTTVAPNELGVTPPSAAPERPAPNGDGQAIFDRIAQSMAYANAYDLGTVELENRFADFDRMSELRERAVTTNATTANPVVTVPSSPQPVGSTEFIQDLDEIRRGQTPAAPAAASTDDADATCKRPAVSLSLDDGDGFSEPFFDSGEHALAADDLYVDQLRVGANPGVPMSYGEIIAMPDFYASVDDMMQASVSELTTLKRLVDRNASYYRGHKGNHSLDVSNAEWDRATNGRYLRLAEDNYDHFSPNVLLHDAVAAAANREGTNKQSWETNHRRAIQEAQRMFLAPENANRSFLPELPLIINAFADHFLTDAFASGHLMNKEVMIAYFRANFFSGASLKPVAEEFFGRVAQAAFVGRVREQFSALETYEPLKVWGWHVPWHPNINSVDRFKALLVQAAISEPQKIANFVVKALHDHLNEEGIEVTNDAGDGTWLLTGDGFINTKTLAVMRKAVRQSVANINDPGIRVSNVDFASYFNKVWRYVPKPTPASQRKLVNFIHDYTSPTSTTLSAAAAKIITQQLESMINVLVSEHKLRRA